MDATRIRRARSSARQNWYATYRQYRFARHMGFVTAQGEPGMPSSNSDIFRYLRLLLFLCRSPCWAGERTDVGAILQPLLPVLRRRMSKR